MNSSGELVVRILQLTIYWITMWFALTEIIKSAKKQDIAGVTSIIIKYGAMMVSAYFMPTLWKFIKELFVD